MTIKVIFILNVQLWPLCVAGIRSFPVCMAVFAAFVLLWHCLLEDPGSRTSSGKSGY